MSRKEQKELEKKDIELFLSLSDLNYNSYDLDYEKPDCDIQLDNKRIGVEITEFVRSKEYCSMIRSVNATLDRIKKETKYAIRGRTDINLTVNFSQQLSIPRKINATDRKHIVSFLVDHLNKKEVVQNLGKTSFYEVFNYTPSENEFIERVSISTSPRKQTLDVTENTFYITGVIPKKDIEGIIRAKEPKMDFTRNNETWLLIVVAETDYSSGIIEPDVLEYKFVNCLFNRVFMLERFSKKLHELNLCE